MRPQRLLGWMREHFRMYYFHDLIQRQVRNLRELDFVATWNSKEIITQTQQTVANTLSHDCLSTACQARR
jgi:Rps23 Pro-64 3,4-dihydroxylase Tpa1-like proline 4-hydroxylase